MSKDEFDSHLKFGQGILIEGFKMEGQDKGLLTAQGFADIKSKYETYDDHLFFKNYRNSIFQILPAGNFELNDQLHQALIENEGQPDTANIKILKARADSQKLQFQLNIDNNMKKKVCFGHNVIFQHVDSGSYVSGTIRPSTGSNGAFTVQVSEKLSESLVFRLLPFRSFEFLDMPIPFDSPILIKNLFNSGFMTFEKVGMGDLGNNRGTYIQKKAIESNDSYRIPVKTQSLKSDIYEVVTHFIDLSVEQKEVPMPWRFKLHVNDVVNDTLIQHDVVYLEHTENGGVLSTSGQNIILKELKESNTGGLAFYECLWEIEKHDASDDAYILRHLMSGMVLGQTEEEGNRIAVLKDISEGKKEGEEIAYIEVKLAKKEGGEINSDSFVSLAWGEELLEAADQEESAIAASIAKSRDLSSRVDQAKMRALYSKNIEYNIRPLVFKKSVTNEHCFIIQQIDDDLKRELLFALSFHSVIIRLREDLQYGAIDAARKIDYLRMMQVTNKIREIKTFIKDCSEQESQLQHIFPVLKRQMICKDLGISELLFELLYFMKENLIEDIFSDKHNQKQKFLQLYNTLYQVINELIRNNTLFKMHVSKWFQFILDDVITRNEACQLNLLKELLKDNEFFVNNFVTRDIVQYLTNSYLNKSQSNHFIEKKYLEIFRLFCIVAKQVNTHNQKLILDHCLRTLKDTQSIYEVQLIQEAGAIYVRSSLDKENFTKLPFKEFREQCMEINSTAWEYFVEYLNLIADLAQGRNKQTESALSKIYTLSLLGDLFEGEELFQAEVPIIRLLHYLYAQSEVYYPIEKRRKILNYNALEEGENISIFFTSSESHPWQPPFDRILGTVMRKLKTYGPIQPEGQENYRTNQTLLTLLKFLWETVNLGFWHDKAIVKELLTDVLNIVAKSNKIEQYDSVTIHTKENILMIACKMECLNIIELISEYDNDIMVQFLAASFKSMEFPQKKFNLDGITNSATLMEIKCEPQLVYQFIGKLPTEDTVQPILQTSICDQMMELANYNNPELTAKAMQIMNRVLQTREKAFKHLYQLMIISEEERLSLISFMQEHRNKFFILEDKNIVNVTTDNQVCNYFMISDPEGLGLIEVLYLLTELMKNQNSVMTLNQVKDIHQTGTFEALGSNRLINFTGERSSTNQMKQQIVYSANLHLKVLNFIFSCSEMPQSQLAMKLLHMSYYFIVSLIENFNQIKAILQWHIPKMIHHIKKNVGCIDFLKQMYDNNKTMLYNEVNVFELIKQICQNIESEDEESYYKSKLLDFFRYLIYCNGRSLKNNQIQILKIMQDDSYQNIMPHINEEAIVQLVNQYEAANAAGGNLEMTPKMSYIYTYFQILTSLIDNQNQVNIDKLVKKYPFDLLVSFLEKAHHCWPLKRNIRAFINRLYYFRPDINTKLKSILDRQLYNIIADLDQYLGDKAQPHIEEEENRKFANPVRFSYLESYYYLHIQETLFSVMTLATSPKIVEELVQYLNNFAKEDLQASHNWLKIIERLGCAQQYFNSNKNIYSNSMIKFINSKIKPCLKTLTEKVIWDQGLPGRVRHLDVDDEEYKAAKEGLVARLLEGSIFEYYRNKDPQVKQPFPLTFLNREAPQSEKKFQKRNENRLKQALRAIFRREKKDFRNQDERIEYNLTNLVSSLKLSPTAQKYLAEEYLKKVDTYYNREDRYDYISKIIELNEKDPFALNSTHKLFFLQFVVGLVQNSNKKGEQEAPVEEGEEAKEEVDENAGPNSFKKEIDEWQPDDYSDNVKKIVATQKRLKKCELGKFIVTLLKGDLVNNIELANSILLCAIAYLLGGNPLTQKNILEQLDKEDDDDNTVFQNIQNLIIQLGKLISKNINESKAQQEEVTLEFTPDTVDNYDFYDVHQKYTQRKNVFEPNSTDQFLYNKMCITTYRRAFKFLQLLCESGNKEGKHFIRSQPRKSIEINFIQLTTKQLRNLFSIFCYDVKEVPLFLLDFILEVTQIPIYQNQKALMVSTFFEDLSQLKATFNNDRTFLERGFQKEVSYENIEQSGKPDKSYVQEIYYKSIKIILSNFQGNSENTFKTLDSKLSSEFLTNTMDEKLQDMKIKNCDDLVAHINDYSNKNQQGSDEPRKNTGFDDDILILLDISTIFLKMRDGLKESSRLFIDYQKFKKKLYDDERQRLENLVAEEGITDEKRVEEEVDARIGSYRCLYTYLQKCLLHIEITDDRNSDQYIYFPKYPVFSSLTGNLRNFIMKQVTRSSHRDKIVSLLSFTDGVKEKIEASYNLKKFKKITETNMTDSYRVAAYLSIILCIFISYFYVVNIQYQEADYNTEYMLGLVRFGLSVLQLTFTVLYVFYWFQLKLWFNPQTINRKAEEETEGGEEEEAPAEAAPAEDAPPEDAPPAPAPSKGAQIVAQVREKLQPIRQKLQRYMDIINEELQTEDQRIYKNLQLWRNAMLLGASIAGTFYFPPMFFLHLIDIFAQIQKLGTILYSAIYNAKSLLLVSVMGVFFTIIFCTVTFSNYMKNVYSPSDSVNDMCDGVMPCVSQLYVSGAIGETMQQFQIKRYIYDIIYFTFFEMLFGNIVSGLMLDAFASLREEAEQLESDKKNHCYICNMKRESIEKAGESFDAHTKKKHFLWNYIFYIYVLERKDQTDYTGLEYYIKNQYYLPDEEMEVKWIPNKGQSEFDVQTEAQLLSEVLQKKQEGLDGQVQSLDETIKEFKTIAKEYIE